MENPNNVINIYIYIYILCITQTKQYTIIKKLHHMTWHEKDMDDNKPIQTKQPL